MVCYDQTIFENMEYEGNIEKISFEVVFSNAYYYQ